MNDNPQRSMSYLLSSLCLHVCAFMSLWNLHFSTGHSNWNGIEMYKKNANVYIDVRRVFFFEKKKPPQLLKCEIIMRKKESCNEKTNILQPAGSHISFDERKKGWWWKESKKKSNETALHDEIRPNYLTYVTSSKASWLPASDNVAWEKQQTILSFHRIKSAGMQWKQFTTSWLINTTL